MSIRLKPSGMRGIALANFHYYERPTEPLYLDRTLKFHDFIYLCEGQWMITENDTDFHLSKDDVLLLPAGRRHYTRLPCAPGTRTMCIHVTVEAGDEESGLVLPEHVHIGSRGRVKPLFEALIREFWSERPHREERLSALFNMLVLELSDAVELRGCEEAGLSEKLISIVNRMPHKRFTIKEVSQMYGAGAKAIDKAMHAATGMSFVKYQSSRKLEMVALQLSVEPDVRLSEIAQTFAFYDEFHLSRAFKQKYGVSPLQYKKENIKRKNS